MQEPDNFSVNDETISSALDEFEDFYSQNNILKNPSEDFDKSYVDDIAVITVNLTRATMAEAKELKKLIDEELANEKLKLVIDLSQCSFIDTTFLGTLVVSLKNIAEKSGELRIVEPEIPNRNLLLITNTFKLFNFYKTKQEAIEGFC